MSDEYENEMNNESEMNSVQEPENTPVEPEEKPLETYSITFGGEDSGEVRYNGVEPAPETKKRKSDPDASGRKGSGRGLKVALGIVAVILVLTLSGAVGFIGSVIGSYYLQTTSGEGPYNGLPYGQRETGKSNEKGSSEEAGKTDSKPFVQTGENLTSETDSVIIDKKNASGTVSINGSVSGEPLTIAEVVNKVQNAVVEIYTKTVSDNPFYGRTTGSGAGSGVIIHADGYIVTNNHVVEGATTVRVRLANGNEYAAELIGTDASSDVALIKIDADEELTVAALGCSEDLAVGEEVVAIGNPLGTLGGTVTNGIVSAVARTLLTSEGNYMTLLQTNAAINPGNSGGGLFNLAGELIGIVNAKYSDEEIEGLGFAIPIDTAWNIIQELLNYGYVTGIIDYGLTLQEYSSPFVYYYGRRYTSYPAGVYVLESEHADIAALDRIVSVNGNSISTLSDFEKALEGYAVGDTITLTLERNGSTFDTTILLTEYVPDYMQSRLNS